jgi:hypothetical protein
MQPSILKTSSTHPAVSGGSPSQQDKNGVRFDCLIIKEFPIELGDNVPKAGAPVSMSQTACRSFLIDLEAYESIRPPRRHRKSLIVTIEARTERLLLAGHSFDEIAKATLTAHGIRVSRDEVIQQHASNKKMQQGLSKFVQSTLRSVLKIMILPAINKNPVGVRILDVSA